MADTEAPEPVVEGPSEVGPRRRLSAVWLIPLLALLVSLGVAWRNYESRGPLIEIVFDNAAGIEAGKTAVRFRDVTVGEVEGVKLSPDLSQVIVSVRIDKDAADYLDSDAQFWVVRPSVTSQGISGLDTVISGAYIDAYWDNTKGERVERFTALPAPPLTPAGQPGTRVRLRAPEGGSMVVGAPVLFKRIQVGRIENIQLTPAGDVMIDLFVNAPNNARLTEGTRFWNASGVSISLGPQGAELNIASLLSIVQGGVAFDTVGPQGEPVKSGHVYQLYDTERAARSDVLDLEAGFQQKLTAYFEGSVRGLEPGAPVQYRGVVVGQVSAVEAAIDDSERGPHVTLRTTLSVAPSRMGIPEGSDADMARGLIALLDSEVQRGMRARLAASGLLSQNLFVDLAMVGNPAPDAFNADAKPYPILPTAPADTKALNASAQGLMERISSLPIEDLMRTAETLLANVNAVVSDPKVRSAPENLGLLISDIRQVVADPGIQEAPRRLAAILSAAEGVVAQVEEQRLVERLGTALDATSAAVAQVGAAASDSVPKVVERINALAARLEELPLEDLVTSGEQLVKSVDALVTSPGVTEIPANLNASLDEVKGILAELRQGGAVADATASMASLRAITGQIAASDLTKRIDAVAAQAEAAIGNVNTASAELPPLIRSLTALSDQARGLPLDELADRASAILATTDELLGTEGARQLPASLAGALDELRATLSELRAGGAVRSVNTTLASAGEAADAITRATEDLPALIGRLDELARRADATLASVGPNSQVNRETLQLLRQVSQTAKSIDDLVTALERKPNSVIFGR
ncbi:MlaD family protein [Amaricoccus solimangrovi]|uniref:MCE family protein n=1 Tax=Amaricoccus solimangrovi TaxID=2589815 RepID=A0A501WDM5_9RHOB|nr:MlaD family protein [Amaricoccus solimangrovi]TPE46585.1 MCE family protein [Amaricoccus solimangrovi]